MKRAFLVLGVAALALAGLAAPGAAHATRATDDGQYFITAGHLNEPTTTFMKTGLDLIIRENESGERGAEVGGAHETLIATLISPDGEEELTQDLQVQRGTTGRYTFVEPYYLTQPGQYTLRLVGNIEDTPVDGVYDVSGPMPAFDDHTFPDTAPTTLDLQARIAELEAQMDAMEEHMAQMMQDQMDAGMNNNGGNAGGFNAFLLFAVLGLGAVALRRRRA